MVFRGDWVVCIAHVFPVSATLHHHIQVSWKQCQSLRIVVLIVLNHLIVFVPFALLIRTGYHVGTFRVKSLVNVLFNHGH